MNSPVPSDIRRHLPSVEKLLQVVEVRSLAEAHGRAIVVREVRGLLSEARTSAQTGITFSVPDLVEALRRRVDGALRPSLKTLINATGVVIHTNLGRAPLPPEALDAVREVSASYSNLEFDLEKGERGHRESHIGRLARLLGTEDALVVNNNAAAVLLAVNTLAEGREVIVSRGELVEIGGSFRIPDVIKKGGARLREVGTTNRTRISDYEKAIGPDTALILKVHPSNFAIVGFAERPGLGDLVRLAKEKGLPLVEDLGSGLLEPLPPPLAEEPAVRESLALGVDLVTFSGDKLLGGPQAGLIAGRGAVVSALSKNPLYRALRVDKMTLAALDTVLLAHENGRRDVLPALRMLLLSDEELQTRASRLVEVLAQGGVKAVLLRGVSAVGGGAAPTAELPTVLVALPGLSPDPLAAALRQGSPAVVARVTEGQLVLDLRSVRPEEDRPLGEAVIRARGSSTGASIG